MEQGTKQTSTQTLEQRQKGNKAVTAVILPDILHSRSSKGTAMRFAQHPSYSNVGEDQVGDLREPEQLVQDLFPRGISGYPAPRLGAVDPGELRVQGLPTESPTVALFSANQSIIHLNYHSDFFLALYS